MAMLVGGGGTTTDQLNRMKSLIDKRVINKSTFKASKDDMKEEIDRRYAIIAEEESDLSEDEKTKKPRYSSWNVTLLTGSLEENPLTNSDREFVQAKIKENHHLSRRILYAERSRQARAW